MDDKFSNQPHEQGSGMEWWRGPNKVWESTDSEIIHNYTNKETGAINWKSVESVRKTRDGYMKNKQGHGDTPKFRKEYADLESGWYDYDDKLPDGTKVKSMYPKINQKSYMSGLKLRRPETEDMLMNSFMGNK